jgi:hypothetical protein
MSVKPYQGKIVPGDIARETDQRVTAYTLAKLEMELEGVKPSQ